MPFIIRDENKLKYISALHKAQIEKNYDVLEELFKEEQEKYFNAAKDFLKEKNTDIDIDVEYEL